MRPYRDLHIITIIVTYNGSAFIKNCLERLIKNIDVANIIIIDNGSRDGTVEIIEKGYKGITLIKLEKNYGFGRANNIGLQMALDRNADFVFLLNQDVYIEDITVRELLEIAVGHPEYAILSPMHLNAKGTALDNHFAQYVSSVLISDLYMDTLNDIYACHFINAAAWLISKKCLWAVGGFDPLFFHYGEDNDYLNRVRYYKMKIGVCPGVRINHDRGALNALSTYPEARKMYLEVLKRLTNINVPFYREVAAIVFQFLLGLAVNLVVLQFKNIHISLRVFFRVVVRLNRIRTVRSESKSPCAFINEKSRCRPQFTIP